MADEGQPASFGALLRQHRLAAGLTQEALADRAGLSARAVQHLERGLGQPQRRTARLLAEALALPTEARDRFARSAAPVPRRRASPRGADLDARLRGARAGPPASSILGRRPDLGGERKHVTVLVADAAGLTESYESFEPDLADELLTKVVPLLVDAVRRFDGTVSVLRGDGIVALFGAPRAHEDHAVRACYAALEMHAAIRPYAEQVSAERGTGVALRIGLDSGEVVVRTTVDGPVTGYTAIGPAVHAAARLRQFAQGWTTLVAQETARLAAGYVQVRPVGPAPGSGLTELAGAFEVVGVQPPRSRFQRVVGNRPLTPFVGRDVELTSLTPTFGRARAGRGQIVAVVGEAGVGKSRLVWECARSDQTDGWRILEAGTDPSGAATSYLAAIGLLRAFCRIEPWDDVPTIREKLAAGALTLDRALEPDLPALMALLDLTVDDATWLALDPPRRRRLTLDAVKRLLLRESREQPLLVIVEDLHWIDGETQALLDSLVESLPAARILLLVSYRPGYEHHWASKSYYTQVYVNVLSASSATELLSGLLGDPSPGTGRAGLDSLKRLLVERTEGNPLFLEESVRSLVETGALVGTRGVYRLAGSIESVRVPATVQTVLAARIDRLASDDKRLLQTAAVIGKDLPFGLLRAIAEAPEADLHAGLARLVSAELLYSIRLFPEPEYTFKHALTHDVAYGSLLQERRRALHARIVEAIERLYADRLDEHVERLAEHAFRAELWGQAAAYGRQAGVKADGRAAYSEAVAAFERTLMALARLPETVETLRDAVDVRLELRQSLQVLHDQRRQGEALGEAERLAERLGDRRRLALVYQFQAMVLATSEPDRGVELARRAVAIGEELDDAGLLATTRYYLGFSLALRGAYHEALAVLRLNLSTLGLDARVGGALVSMITGVWIGYCLSELGEFDEAAALGDEILQIAQQDGRAFWVTRAMLGVVYVARVRDDHPTAILWSERAIELGLAQGVQNSVILGTAFLGQTLARAGRPSEARPLLERGLLLLERAGNLFLYTMHLGWLARVCDAEGDVSRAFDLARQSVEQAAAQGHRGVLAENRWHLATILAHAGERDAEGTYQEALALADELGMRPLQAHCRLGLGKLYRRVGRLDEARAELATAVTMLREMRMAFWLPEADAELADVIW